MNIIISNNSSVRIGLCMPRVSFEARGIIIGYFDGKFSVL